MRTLAFALSVCLAAACGDPKPGACGDSDAESCDSGAPQDGAGGDGAGGDGASGTGSDGTDGTDGSSDGSDGSGTDGTDGSGSDGADGGTEETDWTSDTVLDIAGYYSDLGNYNYDLRRDAFTVSLSTPGSAPLLYNVAAHNNAAQVAVAENDASNWTEGGLWSRFDWTTGADADLYLCHTASDAGSEAAARAVTAPDPTDLAGGCAGFAWTGLRRLAD